MLVFLTNNFTVPALTIATITANANATIRSVLAGTNGLTKAGSGQLTLSGSNTYSGGTFINAGTWPPSPPRSQQILAALGQT